MPKKLQRYELTVHPGKAPPTMEPHPHGKHVDYHEAAQREATLRAQLGDADAALANRMAGDDSPMTPDQLATYYETKAHSHLSEAERERAMIETGAESIVIDPAPVRHPGARVTISRADRAAWLRDEALVASQLAVCARTAEVSR